MSFPKTQKFGIIENPLIFSPFSTNNSPGDELVDLDFLLMDGEFFLLMDGTHLLTFTP